MRGYKTAILLLSIAVFAALIGHVVIDVIGDYALAHDTYDDIDHSSRIVIGAIALAFAIAGACLGLRAAVREARGSENAFYFALRGALPRKRVPFLAAVMLVSMAVLCLMEGGDAWLAGRAVDDAGDLFGGSILLGAVIQAMVALVVSLTMLGALQRLARARIVAFIVGAFLRRSLGCTCTGDSGAESRHRLIFRVHYACRRVAGRAPPVHRRVLTR